MSGLGTLLFAVFVLLAIALHEFGHFATAKWFGIKVERFFIGFGPKIWSTKRGETEYGVAALPLGGYVRISGMNPLEDIPPEDRHRTFKAKPAWQRTIVLVAGSATHFVIALIIFVAILTLVGQPDPDRPTRTIGSVTRAIGGEPSPAARAGIRPGDAVVSIDGVAVDDWDEAVELIHARPGQRVTIRVLRGGEPRELTPVLARQKPDGTKVGFLGVSPEFERVERSFVGAVGEAGRQVGLGARESLVAFKRIFSPTTLGRLFSVAAGREERRLDDPSTIYGVGTVAGDLARRGDFAGLFLLVAGFNIFVGVANLLPLPPLDGGHLAVLGFERLTRRSVDIRKLMPVSAAVVSVLMGLFVLLLYLDIVRPLPSIPG